MFIINKNPAQQLASMYQSFDIIRFFQIYIIQFGLGIFYLMLSFLIIKRDRKRINLILSTYFLLVFIAVTLNVIYAPLNVNPTVLILHYTTIFFFNLANVFILIFILIVLKSEKIFTSTKQYMVIGTYSAILCIIFFIPNGVKIDESTNWRPVWNLLLFLFIVFFTVFTYTIISYFSIQLYRQIKVPMVKKRWNYFFIGLIIYMIYGEFLPIANFLNLPLIRLLTSIFGLSMFITGLLMYYGVGRHL